MVDLLRFFFVWKKGWYGRVVDKLIGARDQKPRPSIQDHKHATDHCYVHSHYIDGPSIIRYLDMIRNLRR